MAQRPASLIAPVIVFAFASVASAQIWSAPGVTGIVDEADQNIHSFNTTGSVSMKSSARGTLDIRFPVQTVENLLVPQQGDCPEMRVVLRDTGPNARVIVRFMRLGVGGEALVGQLNSLGAIDSNSIPPGADPTEYRSFRVCLTVPDGELLIDYASFSYYVEAQLSKTSASANPGLKSVQICPSQDACDP
jgi:hypothetical protein